MGYFLDKLAAEVEANTPYTAPSHTASGLNYALTGLGAIGVGHHWNVDKALRLGQKLSDTAATSTGGKPWDSFYRAARGWNAAKGLAAGGLLAYNAKKIYDAHKAR